MPAEPTPGTIRVLLAGSEAFTRGTVGTVLRADDGIDVVATAATDAETIRLARRTRPDVVLVDSANGLHVLATARRLLAEPGCDGIQVLMFGRFEREAEVLGALRSGIGGLVDKEAAPDELLRAVRMSASGAAFVFPGNGRAPAPRLAAPRPARQRWASVSTRERDVVTLAARGLGDEEIAAQLGVSTPTVVFRLASAMRKLGARDRPSLIAAAFEAGLVEWLGGPGPHQQSTESDSPEE